MAPSPSEKNSALARRFLVVMLGIAGFIVISFLIWRIQIHFRVRSQLAAIRQAGFPTTGAELNNYLPQIPDSDNGALALNAAFAGLHEFRGNRSNNFASIIDLKPSDSWSADARALVQRYLQTNHAALQQIEFALDRYQEFRFPVDYSFGVSDELPHLRSIKAAAQAFRLQTILRAESKDPAWTNPVLSQIKLARALDAEPSFIGYLVRSAILKIASSSAQTALSASAPDPAVCRLLHDAFLAAAATNTLTTALISERALYAPYFRMSLADAQAISRAKTDDESADSSPMRQPTGGGFSPMLMAGFFERDLAFFLSTMEKVFPSAVCPRRKILNSQISLMFHKPPVVNGIFSQGCFCLPYPKRAFTPQERKPPPKLLLSPLRLNPSVTQTIAFRTDSNNLSPDTCRKSQPILSTETLSVTANFRTAT